MTQRNIGITRKLSIKTNTRLQNVTEQNDTVAYMGDKGEPKNLNEIITKAITLRDPQFGKNLV
jgi:hypothetical protein